MYSQEQDYTSDLINSYAWDTAILFIQEFSGDEDYSGQSRLQSTEAKTGEATDGNVKDVRCNIYDMAGNASEWTTETCNNREGKYPCTSRGGRHNDAGYNTKHRIGDTTINAHQIFSFRPIIYFE